MSINAIWPYLSVTMLCEDKKHFEANINMFFFLCSRHLTLSLSKSPNMKISCYSPRWVTKTNSTTCSSPIRYGPNSHNDDRLWWWLKWCMGYEMRCHVILDRCLLWGECLNLDLAGRPTRGVTVSRASSVDHLLRHSQVWERVGCNLISPQWNAQRPCEDQ